MFVVAEKTSIVIKGRVLPPGSKIDPEKLGIKKTDIDRLVDTGVLKEQKDKGRESQGDSKKG